MTAVRVVGTGLLGTSIGLALRGAGHTVTLHDTSPTSMALARDMGAGQMAGADPELVIVATPPDVTAAVVAAELAAYPQAIVTDVASVKQQVLTELEQLVDAATLERYVGSHPMAGRERSGAVAAQADLFAGRSWVVVPHTGSRSEGVALVSRLAGDAGAAVVTMTADQHDQAVAAVSHLPQLAASLVAARLRELPDDAVLLAGQGVRDVTRIAASDPLLWTQILAGNATSLVPVLDALAAELEAVRTALRSLGETTAAEGARGVLAKTIAEGQVGQSRLPGKHGAPPTAFATLVVMVPDEPGQLARLFADIGAAGVNMEDVHLEHATGAQVGLAEISVVPASLEHLQHALEAAGWRVHA